MVAQCTGISDLIPRLQECGLGMGHWHCCYLSISFHPRAFYQPSKIIMAVKVLALDATVEEQRQIKSELEILHKVLLSSLPSSSFFPISSFPLFLFLVLTPLLPEPHRDTPDCVCYAHPYQVVFHSYSPLSPSPHSPLQCNSRYIIGFYGAIFHENRYVFFELST